MTLLDDMMTGRRGVTFAIPERFTATDFGDGCLFLEGPIPGRSWTAHISDVQLDLRPEHDEAHRRDIERHTRALFETFSRHTLTAGRSLAAQAHEMRLRTADPTWSPLVSVERVDVDGQPALTVIHRMCLLPGNEVVMGHLLVPFESGLFEVRSIAEARTTGHRSSILFAKAMNESPGEDPEALMKRLGQRYFDDPSYDILFPDHPLSVVRADIREILEQRLVTVTRPTEITPSSEAELPELNCAITPPPRFVRLRKIDYPKWSRVSFACTDGIEFLSIARTTLLAERRREQLLQLAEQIARATPEGATDVHVEVRAVGSSEDRPQVEAYRSYSLEEGEAGQTAVRWLVDDDGEALMLALGSPRYTPKQELLDEIADVAASWRPLTPRGKPRSEPAVEEAPPKKPWWRIW